MKTAMTFTKTTYSRTPDGRWEQVVVQYKPMTGPDGRVKVSIKSTRWLATTTKREMRWEDLPPSVRDEYRNSGKNVIDMEITNSMDAN